jgi:cytochrome c
MSVGARGEASGSDTAIYTEAQAVRGRDLYAAHCASCHGSKLEGRNSLPLSGATFQATWADGRHSVGDLFYIVRTLMPYGQPATLAKQEYLDIIAFVFMMNGYPAGTEALPVDPATLDSIVIEPRLPQLRGAQPSRADNARRSTCGLPSR